MAIPFDFHSMVGSGDKLIVPTGINEEMFRSIFSSSVDFALEAIHRTEGAPLVSVADTLRTKVQEALADAVRSTEQLKELVDVWPTEVRIQAFAQLSSSLSLAAGQLLAIEGLVLMILFVAKMEQEQEREQSKS